MVGSGQNFAPLLNAVAIEANNERLGCTVANHGECLHDAIGDRVTRSDSTENVDKHALHLRVAQDNVQTGSHHLSRRSTTDVEEVRRLHATVLLPGIGNNIEC